MNIYITALEREIEVLIYDLCGLMRKEIQEIKRKIDG